MIFRTGVRVCTGVTGVLVVFGTVGVVTTLLVADGVILSEGTVKFIPGKERLNPDEPEGSNAKKSNDCYDNTNQN